ncbi:MAG: undecaprenyl-diphosphate phosphatase [Clostridiales bacterium]|jgi:undecaprenyl-diphosphatase|nr:undecaprenyl-diphosphate phosphatase [Clostridiales bacterium]
MNFLKGVLYGMLQGITEFLPVSSSGHLSLMANFFGLDNLEDNNLTFMVFLHLGTLVAVVLVYYRDVYNIIKGFFTLMGKLFTGKIKQGINQDERLFLLIFTATLPLTFAVFLTDKVEFISSISWVIGILLILNGIVLYIADKINKNTVSLESAGIKHSLLVGFVQLLAILPGISRSGSTITGGKLAGYNRSDAVKFSFLLSIPAILGANVFELFKLKDNPLPEGSLPAVIGGVAAAVVSGLIAIKLLEYIAKNKKLSVFSLYCGVVGAAVIIADILM